MAQRLQSTSQEAEARIRTSVHFSTSSELNLTSAKSISVGLMSRVRDTRTPEVSFNVPDVPACSRTAHDFNLFARFERQIVGGDA
jgi:hypothetical protein